jgi:hypothetical protein
MGTVLLETPRQPFLVVHGHIPSSAPVMEMTGESRSM